MWPRFGIKIGNSTLCIAFVKADGKVEVIANKQGDRVSQACLYWDGNEIECGLTAKQKLASHPTQAVANSLQLFQVFKDGVLEQAKEIPCAFDVASRQFQLKLANHDDDDTAAPTKLLSPYDVHVQLLKAEFELARQYIYDMKVGSEQKPIVVLSVPSYFSAESWPPLAQAAEEAGFHVAQIVLEPTAALLAYNIGSQSEAATNGIADAVERRSPSPSTKYVLTIKCGGLFSHFALYEVTRGLYTLLVCKGPYNIGGKQYTEALVNFICEEFGKKYKLDVHESRRSLAKIRTAAANCKHILSTLPSTQIYIDSLMDGIDFNSQISRARYESLIQPVNQQFLQTLDEAVKQMAEQEPAAVQQITDIVLLGATMQIPKLQSVVAGRFADAKLHFSQSADEVAAIGCARQAVYLPDPQGQELQAAEECVCVEEEVLIWHEADEQSAKVLLPKGATLPAVVHLKVPSAKNVEEVATAAVFHIKFGESISEVCLEGEPVVENGIFKIEADISLDGETDDVNLNQQTPVIKLRFM